MTEVNILDQIRKLTELQKIDAEIYSVKKLLAEKPARLAELKEEFEAERANLTVREETLKNLQLDRKSREGELASMDEAIAKANAQLSQIKTNKEYTAKLTEIEHLKADKSVLEEKILMAFDAIDAAKAEVEKEKERLAAREKDFNAQQAQVNEEMKTLEARLKELEGQRERILPEIEAQTRQRYEKILVNREGLAIVPVQGNACGGCYMNVPAQVINEIKRHDKMIFCEMCARILYLEEDLAQTS